MILDSVEERVDIRRACWWWKRLKGIGVRWNDRTDGFIKDSCQPCWFVVASNQMVIELEDVALSICRVCTKGMEAVNHAFDKTTKTPRRVSRMWWKVLMQIERFFI